MEALSKLNFEELVKLHQKAEEKKKYLRIAMARYGLEKASKARGMSVKEYLSPENQKTLKTKTKMTWEQYVMETNKAMSRPQGRKAREAKGLVAPLEV